MADMAARLAAAPDGRLFFGEVFSGKVQVLDDGEVSTFVELEVFSETECGLLGLALDPEFQHNRHVYIYYVEPVRGRDDVGRPRLLRLTEVDGEAVDPVALVDDLPLSSPVDCAHGGGGISFGPDGYLYLSVGDFEFEELAGDLGSPLGKVLRLRTGDGTAAPGNPFVGNPGADPRVFAYGLRNPHDLAFDPGSERLYSTENGEADCDEINIIRPGEDYGHPQTASGDAEPACTERAGVPPIYTPHRPDRRPEEFGSNVAPTGLTFVSGDVYPSLGDALLYCEWNTGLMRRLALGGSDGDRVVDDQVVVEDCQLGVTTGPDGTVYYSNAFKIRKLVPRGNGG